MKKQVENKSFKIVTYGCQMNEHDSEKLNGMLSQMGFEEESKQEDCDWLFLIHAVLEKMLS